MSKIQVLKDIQKTVKECIKLEVAPAQGAWPSSMPLWTSKFGGIPYLPQGIPYPHNDKGKPMYLLAQINFIDMPALEPFPRDGIIQIFVNDDEFYGMDYNLYSSKGFKIQFIPYDTDYNNPTDLKSLTQPEEFPVNLPLRVWGSRDLKPISQMNPLFKRYFHSYFVDLSVSWDFQDCYGALINDYNTYQIGGYPSFVQEGPSIIKNWEDYELLLQIGSDKYTCFGDAGIACFLILREDLKKLDFSRVIYYWDCS
jgi:uncharacterized protein YwqG